MRQRTLIGGLAIGMITPLAGADGTGIWLWDVTTDDGDAIVEPGETASVLLSMHMLPNQGFEVAGISAVIWDTLGMANADRGQIVGWEILNSLGDLTGDLTTTDGVSLFGTNAGQLTVFGPFTSANPIDVLTFQWEPTEIGVYTVQYMTDTANLTVWEGESPDKATAVEYGVAEAAISFAVVPAPGAGALGLAGLALMGTGRRRGRIA
jgi:hypothetical protein